MDDLIQIEGHYEGRFNGKPIDNIRAYNPVTVWSETLYRLNSLSERDQAKAFATIYDVDSEGNEWIIGNVYPKHFTGNKLDELTVDDMRRM